MAIIPFTPQRQLHKLPENTGVESSPGWGAPALAQALYQLAKRPHSSYSRTEPQAGPRRHLASSIPRKQSQEIPLPVAVLVAACPASVAGLGTGVCAPGTELPESRVSGHTGKSFCKQMPQVSSQTGQHTRSVSADPTLKIGSWMPVSGWVCGRHTPHRPAPPDPARTQCAQVRPPGGETGISLGFSQVFFGVPGVGIRGPLPTWSLEWQRPAGILSA